MILRGENDIYIYFETIWQLEPQRVLDIGMFLKRVGSVSRKIMNREIAEHIRLDGVDFFPETSFPVWKQVYDGIMILGQFLEGAKAERYDLAILLGTKELEREPLFGLILPQIPDYTQYLLTDCSADLWNGEMARGKVIDLHVDRDSYYLLDFGVERHGYENLCDDAQADY